MDPEAAIKKPPPFQPYRKALQLAYDPNLDATWITALDDGLLPDNALSSHFIQHQRELILGKVVQPDAPSARPVSQYRSISDSARRMGIHLCSGRGTGKTWLMSRILVPQDLLRRIPIVVLDPLGALVDGILDKARRYPAHIRDELLSRIKLIDTAGAGGVVTPMPLYTRREGESLYSASQPFLDTLRRIDPHLATASIQGWNALSRLGTAVGMVLTALGCQVTEAESLVRMPEAWASVLRALASRESEVGPAVRFLLEEFLPLPEREREILSASFLTKIAPFSLDPSLTAMFGAGEWGFTWEEVIEQRQCLLIDFRNEQNEEMLRFKLTWLFRSLVSFIKRRGPGRHVPLSLVVDEVTFLLSPTVMNVELMTGDMEELVNRLSRNNGLWVTVALQELYQLPETIRKTFLTLGTQIIGATTDRDSALLLAKRFDRFDPTRVKKTEPIFMSIEGSPETIGERTIEYSTEEQSVLDARKYLEIPKFTFLVGVSAEEGRVPTSLEPVTIADVDPGEYVDEERVAELRGELTRRDGRHIGNILTAIEQRRRSLLPDAVGQAVPPASSVSARPARTRRSEPL
jgi:hypothetical protein